jgi:IstB-like ATP binding protein
VGKTHLAIALGIRAVESGFSVAFFRLEELLHGKRTVLPGGSAGRPAAEWVGAATPPTPG